MGPPMIRSITFTVLSFLISNDRFTCTFVTDCRTDGRTENLAGGNCNHSNGHRDTVYANIMSCLHLTSIDTAAIIGYG